MVKTHDICDGSSLYFVMKGERFTWGTMGLIFMLMKWCEVGMIMHTIKWMDIIGNLPIKLGQPILWNWEFTY